jgi:uroporphyrinogen decarboxylase
MTPSKSQRGFGGLMVAAFESRMAAEMARLIESHGGRPLVAPSMREVPLEEQAEALAFGDRLLAGAFDILILMTGVGTRTLVRTLETRHPREAILDALRRATRVCRGPKPIAALREMGIDPGITVPPPNTWLEVLETLDEKAPVRGRRVAVQEYGISNLEMLQGLRERGAEVTRVPIYRWTLPEDLGPLRRALGALVAGEVDVALFTNANQVDNVMRVARDGGLDDRVRAALARSAVASVGPVASQSLREHGVEVDIEPANTKMGPLVREASERCHAVLEAKRAAPPAPRAAGGGLRGRIAAAHRPVPAAAGLSESERAALDASPFMRACRREPTAIRPVWLMRQAGRYMREYRRVRSRVPFLDLCKDPDLVAEVTVHAVERLGVDAAIIFADLLLPVEAFGLSLAYGRGDGPVVDPPVRSAADVDRLREPDVEAALGYVFESIRRTRRALPPGVPLIGFAGAPFTLASYIVEGRGSRDYTRTKGLFYRDAGAWHALLDRIVRLTAAYLNGQIAAGAQAVQLFDSWVGCLSPADYRDYVLPHSRALIRSIAPGTPVIHFGTQTSTLLPLMREAGGDVIGLDWRVDLVEAWDRLGDVAVMGNLDPTVLFAPRPEIRRRAEDLLARVGDRPGHIFNLGHGILPNTPLDGVLELVDAVHSWGGR